MALPPAGPAQESGAFGFTPVTFHFKQVNSTGTLTLRRRAAMQLGSNAIGQVFEVRADSLQFFVFSQDSLNPQLFR